MNNYNYQPAVEAALASSAVVPKQTYLTWAQEGDLGTQGRAYELSARAWDRIQPEPTMQEQCGFMASYLLTCLATNPESDEWVHSGFEAGHELASWLKHLVKRANADEVVIPVASEIERLYRVADAAGRNRIETGALEHILESRALRAYFKHWAEDDVLRKGHQLSLEWGIAHGE